ncbi:hypothetical protein EYC84_010968 [Monilinia fructicola]|uniref:Uncharacterized protein n=1 Tax=Monilinia fructicola TaxID=38448 RepID=A0A5M9J6R7_MONFR|nr:hypothetical protein EYC84_010968 [Monilinia fructicola]
MLPLSKRNDKKPFLQTRVSICQNAPGMRNPRTRLICVLYVLKDVQLCEFSYSRDPPIKSLRNSMMTIARDLHAP